MYRLKLTLVGAKEPVWRCVLVRGEISLRSLNHVIRRTLGWSEDNQYRLDVKWGDGERKALVERRVRLCDVVSRGEILAYLYEYGRGWQVEALVEVVLPAARRSSPVCVAGAGASPLVAERWDAYDRLCSIRDLGSAIDEGELESGRRLVEEAGEPFDLDRVNAVLKRGRYPIVEGPPKVWRRRKRLALAAKRAKQAGAWDAR